MARCPPSHSPSSGTRTCHSGLGVSPEPEPRTVILWVPDIRWREFRDDKRSVREMRHRIDWARSLPQLEMQLGLIDGSRPAGSGNNLAAAHLIVGSDEQLICVGVSRYPAVGCRISTRLP